MKLSQFHRNAMKCLHFVKKEENSKNSKRNSIKIIDFDQKRDHFQRFVENYLQFDNNLMNYFEKK